MKKILKLLIILIILTCLFGCSKKLPKPEFEDGIRGSQLGIDKNINEKTIDLYLKRNDVVYRDMRMLIDEADFAAIGGDSYLSGIIDGFEVVPYPYICNVDNLPDEVGNSYVGATLFTKDEDGSYTANYNESLSILEELFPQDKIIFLMCGGGGYAGMMKELLIYLGWQADKIYNVGGYWYYEGDNAVITRQNDGTYDFTDIIYHAPDFSSLTPKNGYIPPENNGSADDNQNKVSEIIEIDNPEDMNKLLSTDESYGIFIYLPGCLSCSQFRLVVEEFADTKQIPFYSISLELLKDYDMFKNIEYTPSVALVSNKTLLASLDASSNEDEKHYENVHNLSLWISAYLNVEIVEGEAEFTNPECHDNGCKLTAKK